jgi:hypothetical protein
MRSYRIRLSNWRHPEAHCVQHISAVLVTITDGCFASAPYAIAPSPYGKAFSRKSEAFWCLQAYANHLFSSPSKARRKQGPFPPPALPGITGNMTLSGSRPNQHTIMLLRAATPYPGRVCWVDQPLSVTMDDDFCVNALKSPLRKHNSPEIFNADQGSQYTGSAFTDALIERAIKISMDGKGRCMDNVFIERLWRSVKYEKIFLEEFETVKKLIAGLKEYFEFYNFERPHQSFSGKTPAEVYWGKEVAKKAA